MLRFTHLNWDEFEGDILLMEDDSNAQNIGGGEKAVELEDHFTGVVEAYSSTNLLYKDPDHIKAI